MASEIANVLAATLSPDTNTRVAAELRISDLFKTPVRERFERPAYAVLNDGETLLTPLKAFVLSFIAKADYPEEYPTLLSDLLALLSSGNTNSIHGAMQVLSDFIRNELSEDQLLPILRQLLPLLLTVLSPQGGAEQHSPLTRARAVAIFRQCVTALDMVRKEYPDAVNEAISSVLPQWLSTMHTLLSTPAIADVSDPANWDPLAVRIQIFRTLDVIQTTFASTLTPEMTQSFCDISVRNLSDLLPAFRTYYILTAANADKGGVDPPTPVSADDPDINLSLMHLACPAMDYLGEVVRKSVRSQKVAASWVTSNLGTLLSLALSWAQIPVEDEDIWEEDANAFVRDESEGVEAYTARVASLDVVGDLLEHYPDATASWLWNATQNAVKTTEQSKQNGQPDWWRLLEACLSALNNEELVDMVERSRELQRPSVFDGETLLTSVLPPLLTEPGTPFLQGRAFVTASTYARILPPTLMGQYLTAAVEALESSSSGVPLKVAALKAVRNFCSIPDDKPIAPMGPRIVAALSPFMTSVTEDSLALVLEALSTVVQVDGGKWLTPELATQVVQLMLQTYARNANDPISLSITTDIFTFLASAEAPGVYQATVMATVPMVAPTIANNDGWVCCSAMQILTAVFEGAKAGQLGEGVVAALAPSLAVVYLTCLVRKDASQFLGWTDPSDGSTSLQRVGLFLGRLLSPEVEESAGLATGDLLVTLFRKAGDAVGPMMQPLLEVIVKRLSTAKTATGTQSLIIPFAFLIHKEPDSVLGLLESTAIDGQSGLQVLLRAWCENAETFIGNWSTRMSHIALTQLFTMQRPSLDSITVKGDLIITAATSNAPHEYSQIPFRLKALKLILSGLQLNGESAILGGKAAEFDDGSSVGDDGEWEDEEKVAEAMMLSRMSISTPNTRSLTISPEALNFETDDQPGTGLDDEEFMDDPIMQVDLRDSTLAFLKECATRNTSNFNALVDHAQP
ncbi:related to KAP114-Member of the karyopherin-beta family, nuclear import [Serendipita indica DSM 11827]|uniref:Related to KAP114-Member of the karyopherin-beta family, nuclear import n=1 Tax=Serendipita indica (strain DSM 11827) TaxID=1109443 RepID=G4TQS2_SERID|nr:related to KAP114-Member of the karyopherin-beta family, nuclear import [Serendipita indica DSM 11827]